jgi:hypothetical protein
LEFSAADTIGVVHHMSQLAAAGDGWINLLPGTSDDETPTSLGFFNLFGGGSIGVTMCTWIPGQRGKDGRPLTSLGIAHTIGRRLGTVPTVVTIPETWIIEQDHPRRGLVLQVPSVEPHERVLAWALTALAAVSPLGAIGNWRADIYLPAES